MDLKLYLAIKNELNLRAKGETGKLFTNQSTEQLKQLVTVYEKEIFQYIREIDKITAKHSLCSGIV